MRCCDSVYAFLSRVVMSKLDLCMHRYVQEHTCSDSAWPLSKARLVIVSDLVVPSNVESNPKWRVFLVWY